MPRLIVPWTPGCEHRSRALRFLRLKHTLTPTVALGPSPWCKAAAVMPAILGSSDSVIVVADADVWTDGLADAIGQVERGAPWAVPHRTVHRLTHDATDRLVAGEPWQGLPVEQRPYVGLEGGGVVVAQREVLLSVPMDVRFVGWGQEDECWAMALRCLAGPPWRGSEPLVHLWHPPQERLSRRRGSREGWALRRRYVRARNDPRAMRALIEEARRCCLSSSTEAA